MNAVQSLSEHIHWISMVTRFCEHCKRLTKADKGVKKGADGKLKHVVECIKCRNQYDID